RGVRASDRRGDGVRHARRRFPRCCGARGRGRRGGARRRRHRSGADGTRAARSARRRRTRASARLHVGGDGAQDGRRLPRGDRGVKVSGIVIATGPEETTLLERSVPALLAQVDELVIVANGPGSVEGDVPAGARVIRNTRMLGFSANINAGTAATSGEYIGVSNPHAAPPPNPVPPLL